MTPLPESSPPEMYSIALSNGNKATVGIRLVPITPQDFQILKDFLNLLEKSLVSNGPTDVGSSSEPPVPIGSAGRVIRGHGPHFPTEVDLATASERIALRDNIRWTTNAMEQARQQDQHVRKASEKSSNESGGDLPS